VQWILPFFLFPARYSTVALQLYCASVVRSISVWTVDWSKVACGMASKFSRPAFLLWGYLKSIVYDDSPLSATLEQYLCCMHNHYPSDHVACVLKITALYSHVYGTKMDTDKWMYKTLWCSIYMCGFVDLKHFATVGHNAMLFLYKYINMQWFC
jgi:hypothetical protein